MGVFENVGRVREQVDTAAHRAGRRPEEVALMAVSKTKGVDYIVAAYSAGQRLFGENRVQEFAEKVRVMGGGVLTGMKFHMIGHLQSNKAKLAAELFSGIDSVDSLKLAERLNASAEELGKTLDILIEINVGGEEVKSGLAPDSPEIVQILERSKDWQSLRVRGLMTVPPFTEDPEGARPFFRQLRELRDSLAKRGHALDQLSMGMSHDFEVAIEEGSTCVRVGTAIFGARPKPQ